MYHLQKSYPRYAGKKAPILRSFLFWRLELPPLCGEESDLRINRVHGIESYPRYAGKKALSLPAVFFDSQSYPRYAGKKVNLLNYTFFV